MAKAAKQATKKKTAKSQSDEAQELLKQMQAKSDADICPFC